MEEHLQTETSNEMLSFDDFRASVLNDFRIVVESREASLLGRREVLTGKAKFGIFGDGKEVAQVALARNFKNGDWRSGYYRDQTLIFATGISDLEQFFSQMYADTNPNHDTMSSGRNMICHYVSKNINENGEWLPLAETKNTAADIAPTAAQMPRALGLAFASKQFRNNPALQTEEFKKLSDNGNEVCFSTIGDAATSEGHFWETMNAAGVLQVPLAAFVWDDGYGISVPTKQQTTKGSISEALAGLKKQPGTNGIDIYTVKGWDYQEMCEVFEKAIQKIRDTHIPALFHVTEITQPQGHSTSGSHERYKSQERLQWERHNDCVKKMREWIIENGIAEEDTLDEIRRKAKEKVREARKNAYEKYITPLRIQAKETLAELENIRTGEKEADEMLVEIYDFLKDNKEPMIKDSLIALSKTLNILQKTNITNEQLDNYYQSLKKKWHHVYDKNQLNEGITSALKVEEIKPVYTDNAKELNGFEILNKYFENAFATNNKLVAFGEDLGHIGDVNQGFSGLQQKFGKERIFDTGIRELSIIGKGMGLALRGLRPIAEIQYLDYLLYGLEPLSDDVATLHYRTDGRQSCPLIVRTRGHRLEGMFHSGSPMGTIINSLRGMHVCVPRDMTRAAGMYNTLLKSNDPGLIIECLNGYRLKELLPQNLTDITVPMGVPEVLKEGTDVTIVSYGSVLRQIERATIRLDYLGISCEIIDVQTLLPFDINHTIVESLKKTNRILFVDEDVPGGAAAFMFNKVIEEQEGYKYLDIKPRTLTGKEHRPAYASDGDYFSKPNIEDIVETVNDMMME